MANEVEYNREDIKLVTSEGYDVLQLDTFKNDDKTVVNVYELVFCKEYRNVIVTSVKAGEINEILYPKLSDITQSCIKSDIAIMTNKEYRFTHDVLYRKLAFGEENDFTEVRYDKNDTSNYVLSVKFIAFGQRYTACVHKNRRVYIIGSYIQFNKQETKEIAEHLFDIFNIDTDDFIR